MADKDRITTDRLKADIDSGKAGDKIPFSDPAAAPLGTDDEAAGTPPTEEQIRRAREAEVFIGREDESRAENNRTIPERQGSMMSGRATVMIGAAALVILLIATLLI